MIVRYRDVKCKGCEYFFCMGCVWILYLRGVMNLFFMCVYIGVYCVHVCAYVYFDYRRWPDAPV